MKSIQTSRSKGNSKPDKLSYKNPRFDFQQDDISDGQSEGSIEFSVSFPSQTKRSQSPGLRGKSTACKCGCAELKTTLQRLKIQNLSLASENRILKAEIQKFKKQNQQVLEIKSIASKRLQAKNIECEELRFRVKELASKVQRLETQNLNISMGSLKNMQDQENTLTTICLQKDKAGVEEEGGVFGRKLQQELAKYVEVKMKLDLTLRKLEQKELMIAFLQGERGRGDEQQQL